MLLFVITQEMTTLASFFGRPKGTLNTLNTRLGTTIKATGDWDRPSYCIWQFKQGSLGLSVDALLGNIQKIEKNAEPDDRSMIKEFMRKFEPLKDEWMKMMEKMLQVAVDADALYYESRYYGIYDAIVAQFSNVSLSFIIFGPNERAKIMAYLEAFPQFMKNLQSLVEKIHEARTEYEQLERTDVGIKQAIAHMKANLVEYHKLLDETNDESECKEIQEKIDQTSNALTNAKANLKICSQQKAQAEERITTNESSRKDLLYRNAQRLSFNYFMHDLWCLSLEPDLKNVM